MLGSPSTAVNYCVNASTVVLLNCASVRPAECTANHKVIDLHHTHTNITALNGQNFLRSFRICYLNLVLN